MTRATRSLLLNLAKSIFIGHAVVIVIVSLFIVRCASDLGCLLTTISHVPIAGVPPDELDVLNRELGMTDNLIGAGFVYLPALVMVVVALNADNIWLARRAAVATFVITLLADSVCALVCYRLRNTIDESSIHFAAQNAIPLTLVCLASVVVLVVTHDATATTAYVNNRRIRNSSHSSSRAFFCCCLH